MQIQLLRDEEARLGVQTRPNRPRVLILGPTRELADQILRVAKSLSHYAAFRSACVTGGQAALMHLHGSRLHECILLE